jgi:hypothetical protein
MDSALPHAHQPHRIDAKIRKRIPLLRGDRRQVQSLPVTQTQFIEPYPGGNLVNEGSLKGSSVMRDGSNSVVRPRKRLGIAA